MFVPGNDVHLKCTGYDQRLTQHYQVVSAGTILPRDRQLQSVWSQRPTYSNVGLSMAPPGQTDRTATDVYVRKSQGPLTRVCLTFERTFQGAYALTADRNGVVYLAGIFFTGPSDPVTKGEGQVTVIAFTTDGQYVGQTEMPMATYRYATQPLIILTDGSIYHMETSPEGLRIVRYTVAK
jgi:hypothetical protein